jgi:hypothetical protein
MRPLRYLSGRTPFPVPAEARQFREAVAKEIERRRYRPPDSKRDGEPFREMLKKAGVLKRFLSRALQEEIEKWVLLRDTFREDSENKDKGRSEEGFPAQFHRSMVTSLLGHLRTLEAIADKHDSQRGIKNYYSFVQREFVRHVNLLISLNRPPAWPDLLEEKKQGFSPRSEEVSIRARIFHLLKYKLQNPRSERLGVSDQLLRQLTELLLSEASTDTPPIGDRTRYAVNSRISPGNNSKKLQKQ